MVRRFSASTQRVTRDFYKLMTELSSTSLRIGQDIMQEGQPVEVIFDRNGQRYVFRCNAWGDATDNLRAIYHTIRFLYKALHELGVVQEDVFDVVFEQVFSGFLATPDDSVLLLGDGRRAWWEVLGVEKDASKSAVINAFRALSKTHHPDTGGDPEDFLKLRKAYEQALAQLPAKGIKHG